MQIVFNVEKEIESRGWSEAWYELEDITKTTEQSLKSELWRAYPELGGQIAQSTVEADGEKVVIETAHNEIEDAVRASFEQVLLETLSASFP